MKTKNEVVSEMLESLHNDKIRLEILRDYRTYVYEQDEDLKSNIEAKKELDTNNFQIRNTNKMITWLSELK